MEPKKKFNSLFLTSLFLGFNSGAVIAAEQCKSAEKYLCEFNDQKSYEECLTSVSGKLNSILSRVESNLTDSTTDVGYDKAPDRCTISVDIKPGGIGIGFSREFDCPKTDPYSKDPYSKDPYSKDPYSKDVYSKDVYSKDTYSKDAPDHDKDDDDDDD